MLGGFNPSVPCYAGGIDLEFTLNALLKQTDDNLARGFRAIKMKVGRARLSEDRERVRAMRAHLGDDFPLMADANMRWTVDQSIAAARAFQDSNLTWLEEPTIPDDVAGHARIVREGGVPIATGENLHTLHEFTQMISAGGVTFPEPDVTNCGGITVFMKVAHLAEAFNLPLTSHGAHDLTVHLLAAVPEPVVSGSAWLRARSLHRAADHHHRGQRAGAGRPARPRRRVRLEGAGKDAGEIRANEHGTALGGDVDRCAGAGRRRGVQ